MSVPASRSLTAVLRHSTRPLDAARVLVGAFTGAAPSDSAHAVISLGGATLEIPKPPGEAAGAAAYMLAWPGRLLLIGGSGQQGATGPPGPTGSPGPTGPSGATTFLAKPGPPTNADGANGAVYLDLTSLRLWGPKAAGAWPAGPFARLMPLNPTYAQVKAG